MTKEEKKEYQRLYRQKSENKEKMKLYHQNYILSKEAKERRKEYKKGNKDGIIYTITNPIGQVYVGTSNMLPNIRWSYHKTDFKFKKGNIPLLHQSFDKWGVDTHLFTVIKNYGDINKKELLEIEGNMIKHLNSNGKSLNKNKI
jgi:hypothetical protein